MDSAKNDLSVQVLKQALAEFLAAPTPAPAGEPAPAVARPSLPSINLVAILGALAGLDLLVAAAVVLFAVLRRRRPVV
jgi:hypothetical protein